MYWKRGSKMKQARLARKRVSTKDKIAGVPGLFRQTFDLFFRVQLEKQDLDRW